MLTERNQTPFKESMTKSTDDLADVKITTTTTINAEITLGSVYADYVFRAYGDDILEQPGGLLKFLEALAEAKDAVQPCELADNSLLAKRERIVDYLSTPGASILDVDDDLGFTPDETIDALCNGRPSIVRSFDDLRWLEIESVLDENPSMGSKAFASLVGITRSNARSILAYYGR
jgi:hypothetical protein